MWAQRIAASATVGALLLSSALVTAVTLDCKNIVVDGQHFDLGELAGPHSVHQIEDSPPSISNTTFTIDICNPLKRTKGVPKDNECPSGTFACGIEYDYNLADNSSTIKRVIPIAGQYAGSHGRYLDPAWTRLKNSPSHSDAIKEGLRVELHGGKYPFDKSSGRQQKAIIEFQCDRNRTGLEGTEKDSRDKLDDQEDSPSLMIRAEDENDGGDEGKPANNSSMQLVSYRAEGEGDAEFDVLRLNWKTKYACEGMTEHKPTSGRSSSHWGFFTWFLIIVFLLIATYLIFGSWLNYNRYGARGWDAVPFGDNIRDTPYLLKDWGRSLTNLVKGQGSRGGYSAV